MRIDAHKRRVRAMLVDVVSDVEKFLRSAEAEWRMAKQVLPSVDFVKFDDWMRQELRGVGMAAAFALVVDVGMSVPFVARNVDLSGELYDMAGKMLGGPARDVLSANLPNSLLLPLQGCQNLADLYVNGIPYPFPDGTLVELRKLSPSRLAASKEFCAATTFQNPGKQSVVEHHELPGMKVLDVRYEMRKGVCCPILVMCRKDGRGGEVGADVADVRRILAKSGF